ncbi:MAG: hypothetical protein JO000_08755 [Alphaproteobacteria bacterium]|nr:hypothetical protein [Alphaproteobacteria bacterium]
MSGYASVAQAAECGADLLSAQQNLERTRAGYTAAARSGTPAQKCAALRKHVASLTRIRAVFARCDKGANKAQNAAQVGDAITTFNAQIRTDCPGPKKS